MHPDIGINKGNRTAYLSATYIVAWESLALDYSKRILEDLPGSQSSQSGIFATPPAFADMIDVC